MQITSSISNRYPNLQVMTGAKTKNVNQAVSAEAIVNTEKKNNTAQTSSVIPTGYSYFPEIIDDSRSEPAIEKVSFVNGICSDVEKAAEYEREVYGQRNEIDYSGMSGGEIITSIIDRYSQYFECDNLLNLQGIANSNANLINTSYNMAYEIYGKISDEIYNACEKYDIDSKQAFSEYYGYEDMTNEEKMKAIASKYSDNGMTYCEYLLMIDDFVRVGSISGEEHIAAFMAMSGYQTRSEEQFSSNTFINLNDVANNIQVFLDEYIKRSGNIADMTILETTEELNIIKDFINRIYVKLGM